MSPNKALDEGAKGKSVQLSNTSKCLFFKKITTQNG